MLKEEGEGNLSVAGRLLPQAPLLPPSSATSFLGNRPQKPRTHCGSRRGAVETGGLEPQNPEQKGALKTMETNLGLL